MRHAIKQAYLILALVLACIASADTHATVQEEDCIDPAVEYPVPCDDDD